MQSDEELGGLSKPQSQGQLVTVRLAELHPHPSFVRNQLTTSPAKLSALAEIGDLAFQEPILIAADRTILDGYARFELARLQGRPVVVCLQYELTEAESLQFLIQRHRRSNGFNDFCRILLALELEPWLRHKAESNQRHGGQHKGLSKLIEAEKVVVQRQIANAAGVSDGNVSKVKQLISKAHPEVLQALRNGEIRIHRAWLWSKSPIQEQPGKLRAKRIEKRLKKTARTLVSRQLAEMSRAPTDPPSPTLADLDNLVSLMSKPESGSIGPITMALIDAPGKAFS